MSTEHTPTTDAMRERASRLPLTPGMSIDAYDWNHRLEAARRAEFDRWLASVKADAWYEGAVAGYADGDQRITTPDLTPNPYEVTS